MPRINLRNRLFILLLAFIGGLTISFYIDSKVPFKGLQQLAVGIHFIGTEQLRPKPLLDTARLAGFPLDIGCFGPSSRTLYSGNISAANTLFDCKRRCAKDFIYYIYQPHSLKCVCKDKYDPVTAREPRECNGNHTSSLIGIRGNVTGLVIKKFLEPSGRKCRCTTNGCDKMRCNNVTLSSNMCWTGPRREDLIEYQKFNASSCCPDTQYTITLIDFTEDTKLMGQVCKPTECVYCIRPDNMYGFWPITQCSNYHPLTLSHSRRRLYRITPPARETDRNSITVYTKKRSVNTTKILLMGYFRSGSTFTSELFRKHRDAFYLFEPFHSVIPNDISIEHEEIHDHLVNQTTVAMNSIFNCDLLQLSYATYNRFSQADIMAKFCEADHIIDCVNLFTSRCQAQKMTVVKSIRARMRSVQVLIDNDKQPDLKVVLLLRDPRGIMRSRLTSYGSPDRAYAFSKTEIFAHAENLCKAMADDVQRARAIQKGHPNQVVIVHYEDIANYSTTAANHLYRELNLNKPPPEIAEAVEHLEGTKDGNAFGIHRKDSVATAYKWKRDMQYDQVELIDKACADSYMYTGYKAVMSKTELSNPNNYHRVQLIPLV